MYESLEVRIDKAGPDYLIAVTQSAAGDAEGLCTLDLQAPGMQSMLAAIAQHTADEELLVQLGTTLFRALFHDAIESIYRTCLATARAHDKGLRLRLNIDPPELAALPWEFLFDSVEDTFLAISTQTAVVRYTPIQAPATPTEISLPLRVLVVSAAPRDFPLLDSESGAGIVKEALAELVAAGQAEVEVVEHAGAATIMQAMRRVRPHIFHFIGHGAFEGDRGVVLLEDSAGNARPVSDRTFREFLTGHTDTRLAVLSACQSAAVSTYQPLVGLAPRLLQRQVSAVVAMQYPIREATAFIFARDFYRSIALGLPLEAAISEGRRAIYLEAHDKSDWGIPVLFLRAQDGTLFPPSAAGDMAGAAANGGTSRGINGARTASDDHKTADEAADAVSPPPAPLPPPTVANFVGRERELKLYREILRKSGCAVITGMPGVGKTALAARIALSAAPQVKIFWHTFYAHEGLDTLLWELAGFVAWHGNDRLWQLLQRSHQPPPAETLLVSLLQTLGGQDYVICLDDLQFAEEDPALAAAIKRIVGACASSGLRLIATADRILAIDQLAQPEPLGGMSVADLHLFLAARQITLQERLSAELHAKTGGNVQLLNLAAHVLLNAPEPVRVIRRLAQVDNIGYFLLNEVDTGLAEAERSVMWALAVLGSIPSRAAAVGAILDGENPRRTLLSLIARYLVTSQMGAVEQEYSIHSILQSFYYDGLDQRERQIMHARAGAYFEHGEASYLRAASHFRSAGQLSHAADLATTHVRELINQGQSHPLRALLESFEVRELPPLAWVEVKLAHTEVCRILGDGPAMQASCQEALRTLDRLKGEPDIHVLRARACRGMGLALKYEKPREALSWFERGLAELGKPLAGEIVAPEIREETALLHLYMGGIQYSLGDYDAALVAALKAVEDLPPHEELLLAYNYRDLGTIYSVQGDFALAAHYNELSLAICRRLHDDLTVMTVLNNMGIDKEITGDWEGAAVDYQEALQLAEQLESVVDQVRIGNALANLSLRRGDDTAAAQQLAQAMTIARSHAIQEGLLYLLHTQADLELSCEELAAAERTLAEAEKLAGELDAPYVLVEILISQAQLSLARGNAPHAQTQIEQTLTLAEKLELELEKGKALRVQGQVHLALDNRTAAGEAFAKSLPLLADEPYEVARTQAAWGAALLSSDRQQGIALLEEAAATFARLGAVRAHKHVSALLYATIGEPALVSDERNDL